MQTSVGVSLTLNFYTHTHKIHTHIRDTVPPRRNEPRRVQVLASHLHFYTHEHTHNTCTDTTPPKRTWSQNGGRANPSTHIHKHIIHTHIEFPRKEHGLRRVDVQSLLHTHTYIYIYTHIMHTHIQFPRREHGLRRVDVQSILRGPRREVGGGVPRNRVFAGIRGTYHTNVDMYAYEDTGCVPHKCRYLCL